MLYIYIFLGEKAVIPRFEEKVFNRLNMALDVGGGLVGRADEPQNAERLFVVLRSPILTAEGQAVCTDFDFYSVPTSSPE